MKRDPWAFYTASLVETPTLDIITKVNSIEPTSFTRGDHPACVCGKVLSRQRPADLAGGIASFHIVPPSPQVFDLAGIRAVGHACEPDRGARRIACMKKEPYRPRSITGFLGRMRVVESA